MDADKIAQVNFNILIYAIIKNYEKTQMNYYKRNILFTF